MLLERYLRRCRSSGCCGRVLRAVLQDQQAEIPHREPRACDLLASDLDPDPRADVQVLDLLERGHDAEPRAPSVVVLDLGEVELAIARPLGWEHEHALDGLAYRELRPFPVSVACAHGTHASTRRPSSRTTTNGERTRTHSPTT